MGSSWPDKISTLAVAYTWTPIFMYVVFQNRRALCVALAVFGTAAFTELVKHATRHTKWKCLKRPDGAADCNISNGGGPVAGRPGFPSGHCATSAVFWTCVLLSVPGQYRIPTMIVGVLATVAMMWARMQKRCHTFLQCISGVALGIAVGFLTATTCF